MIMKKIAFIVIFFAAVLVLSGISKDHDKEKQVRNEVKKEYENYHYSYFTSKEAYGNLEQADETDRFEKRIYGGILSHHFLVSEKISAFFSKIKDQEIKTVAIIGPNHFNAGESNILVSNYPYKTPWGVLEPEEEKIRTLVESGIARNDEQPFEKEHSISTLVSYVKLYLPDAKIIPVIIKRDTRADEAERLAGKLNEMLGEDSLVLASVDFSHHLDRMSSRFHDEISVARIRNFDYEGIYSLEIDSPPSIYALLKYLDKKGAKKMSYEQANSADYTSDPDSQDVTSYLFAHFAAGEKKAAGLVSVLGFGDAMFDRDIKKNIEKGEDPFGGIRGSEGNFLRGTDYIMLNLEGPITEKTNCFSKTVSFSFPPAAAKLLFENGINEVSFSNNHTNDCLEQGVIDTKEHLEKYGIDIFGISVDESYVVKKKGGQRTVFLAIDDVLGSVKLDQYYELVKKLKRENDHVIVSIHWGAEYDGHISARQMDVGHRLIDSGADVIIGHHPHVVQGIERHNGKVIFYSLGNFIFDQQTPETMTGLGVGMVLGEEKDRFYLYPMKLRNNRPELMKGDEMTEFCKNMLSSDRNQDMPCYFEN